MLDTGRGTRCRQICQALEQQIIDDQVKKQAALEVTQAKAHANGA
jgi:hypothetical protein